MRRVFLAIPLVFALAGCATTGGTSSVSQIQSLAVAACGFLPTAATVAQILAAGNPLISTAEAVATAICAAVVPAKAAMHRGAALPTVSGVVVHGKFVR